MSISVVIPCYNSERWIGEALASVRAQSRPPDEVIVVDDASTDGSIGLVSRFQDVRLISQPRNAGPASARNAGLMTARGELVAFLDSDDIWEPDHLATVAGLLAQHRGAVLAFSLSRMFGDRERIWDAEVAPLEPTSAFWPSWRHAVVPMSASIVRRAEALAIGGFDPTLRCVEDYDFFLRLAWKHDFVCTHQVTARYRKHAGSLSRQFLDCVITEFAIRNRFLADARKGEPGDFVDRLEREWRGEYEVRLLSAWTERDPVLLRFYLGLAILVPGSRTIARRWRRRSRLMSLQPIWDRLHGRARRAPPDWPGG